MKYVSSQKAINIREGKGGKQPEKAKRVVGWNWGGKGKKYF